MELWIEKLKTLRLLYAEDEEGIRKRWRTRFRII